MRPSDYISFAATKSCNFRCPYCTAGGQGEAQFSRIPAIQPGFIDNVTRIARSLGVTRFRLGGGEPLLHPQFRDLVAVVLKHQVRELVVATNASLVHQHVRFLSSLVGSPVKLVASLDAVTEAGFDFHSGSMGERESILRNVRTLAKLGLLKRINTVVTRQNVRELPDIAEFCNELGVPLKLADVADRPNQSNDPAEMYVSLTEIDGRLEVAHTPAQQPDYSRWFGVPCERGNLNGVDVRLKNAARGTRYNLSGPCGGCRFFPCSEGLYFITVLPDGQFSGCQSNGYSIALTAEELEDAEKSSIQQPTSDRICHILRTMMRTIGDAELILRSKLVGKEVRPRDHSDEQGHKGSAEDGLGCW